MRPSGAVLLLVMSASCAPSAPAQSEHTRATEVAPQRASAVADRVVAVVGARAVLLSELNERVRAQPAKALNAALDELIDDELIQQQARWMHISVDDDVVERVAHARGCDEAKCRENVRRQMLEGLMLKTRLAGLHVTDEEARAEYKRLLGDNLDGDRSVDLEVAFFPGGQRAVVEQLVAQARAGGNFCVLTTCSSRGLQPIQNVIPAARRMLASMKIGDVSDPIEIGTVIIVFRLKARGRPSFDQVRDEMIDRATENAVMRERRVWLEELRATTHVERRL